MPPPPLRIADPTNVHVLAAIVGLAESIGPTAARYVETALRAVEGHRAADPTAGPRAAEQAERLIAAIRELTDHVIDLRREIERQGGGRR